MYICITTASSNPSPPHTPENCALPWSNTLSQAPASTIAELISVSKVYVSQNISERESHCPVYLWPILSHFSLINLTVQRPAGDLLSYSTLGLWWWKSPKLFRSQFYFSYTFVQIIRACLLDVMINFLIFCEPNTAMSDNEGLNTNFIGHWSLGMPRAFWHY